MVSVARSLLLALAAMLAGMPAVSAADKVLVPRRVIYPGQTIDANALEELTLIEGRKAPEGMAVTLSDLEGKVAKRTLLSGRYVQLNALREAFMVDKGAAVEVTFVAGALEISASAVTLTAGSIGDVVKVRNVDSGKILSGTVMADGSVRVGGS